MTKKCDINATLNKKFPSFVSNREPQKQKRYQGKPSPEVPRVSTRKKNFVSFFGQINKKYEDANTSFASIESMYIIIH